MPVERAPGSLIGMDDDRLAGGAVSLVVSELKWYPDVAPAVLDRISRDAVAYPEQFDRRLVPPTVRLPGPSQERTAGRTLARLTVFGLLFVVVVGLVFIAASANAAEARAAADGLAIELQPVADGFDEPVFVTHAGDGSGALYVVEKPGRIRVIGPDGGLVDDPFLDLTDRVLVGSERGLLGLAFHPAYGESGRLFVNYTRSDDGATVVSEFTATDGAADPASERELLVIEQPFSNHNGGMIAFDADGYLLIGTGDGGSAGDPLGAGQDPSTLLGKLLRIDVDGAEPYGIPADNGFAESDAALPEIHAKGLRNPWRFSVDPAGGHIFIGDVGQSDWEEVSVLAPGSRGADLGWADVEGPACFRPGCDLSASLPPAVSYGHDQGCSVVGGPVYRGTSQPLLDGVYLFGDYCSGRIWGASAADMIAGPAEAVQVGTLDGTLASFGVDSDGEVYAVDLDGRVLQVVAEEMG